MHFLTSLTMIFGIVFVVCLGLVKLTWDLSHESVHESPAIMETPVEPATAQESSAKATESYESSPMELSDMR
jgi:hypothetical protein